MIKKQGRRESNSQPLVLETSALPIELHPYSKLTKIAKSLRPPLALKTPSPTKGGHPPQDKLPDDKPHQPNPVVQGSRWSRNPNPEIAAKAPHTFIACDAFLVHTVKPPFRTLPIPNSDLLITEQSW